MFSHQFKYNELNKILIGKGAYGEVYRFKHEKKTFAYKITHKDEDDVHHPGTLRELAILSRIKHENLAELLGIDFTNDNGIILYMNFYETNLQKLMFQKKSNENATWIIDGLIKGLSYLHSIYICHRDLKPENILITLGKKEVKICDFGLSRFATNKPSTIKIVSPPYRAPELLSNIKEKSINMYKVDIWSLGCILYEIYVQKHLFIPFKNDTKQSKNIIDTLSNNEWINTIQKQNNQNIYHILKKILIINPEERYDIYDIFDLYNCKEKYEYKYIKTTVNCENLKCSKEQYHYIIKNLKQKIEEKKLSSYTLLLCKKYLFSYLSLYSIHPKYQDLLYKTIYYIALRINEFYYPSLYTIFEHEFSPSDINEMEKIIIKSCNGNLYMFDILANEKL